MQIKKKRALGLVVLLVCVYAITSMSLVEVNAKEITRLTADGLFSYKSDTENNGYMIVKYLGKETTVVIPNLINGKPVTAIGDWAFWSTAVTEIVFPESLRSVGKGAFYECKQLQSIKLPDGLTDLAPYAFGSCDALTSFNIPKGITKIPAYAFEWANITSLDIPDNITKIGEGAFGFCMKLNTLTLSNSVTEIGKMAFQSCTGLKSFEVPKNVTKISNNAFMYSGITTLTVSPENPVYSRR